MAARVWRIPLSQRIGSYLLYLGQKRSRYLDTGWTDHGSSFPVRRQPSHISIMPTRDKAFRPVPALNKLSEYLRGIVT